MQQLHEIMQKEFPFLPSDTISLYYDDFLGKNGNFKGSDSTKLQIAFDCVVFWQVGGGRQDLRLETGLDCMCQCQHHTQGCAKVFAKTRHLAPTPSLHHPPPPHWRMQDTKIQLSPSNINKCTPIVPCTTVPSHHHVTILVTIQLCKKNFLNF